MALCCFRLETALSGTVRNLASRKRAVIYTFSLFYNKLADHLFVFWCILDKYNMNCQINNCYHPTKRANLFNYLFIWSILLSCTINLISHSNHSLLYINVCFIRLLTTNTIWKQITYTVKKMNCQINVNFEPLRWCLGSVSIEADWALSGTQLSFDWALFQTALRQGKMLSELKKFATNRLLI